MSPIPFDGIITLLIFLVGLPALIVQFMPAEVRRIVYDKLVVPYEVRIAFGLSVATITSAILLVWMAELNDETAQIVWLCMFAILIIVILYYTYMTQMNYGRREKVIDDLRSKVYLEILEMKGRKKGPGLEMMIELGKQSAPGTDRELVLVAMKTLVLDVCALITYQGDRLEALIQGVVEILATKPEAEGLRNYKTAVELLTEVLRPPHDSRPRLNLVDQQQAVRALSELGQTVLIGMRMPTSIEYILMGYVQAFGRAAVTYPQLVTDITQALYEVGVVAVENDQHLFAVATLERLRAIITDPPTEEDEKGRLKPVELRPESYVDLLALMAHFWAKDDSLRDFIEMRIPMVEEVLKEPLKLALKKAARHCQMTMKFSSADRLEKMAAGLKKSRKKA